MMKGRFSADPDALKHYVHRPLLWHVAKATALAANQPIGDGDDLDWRLGLGASACQKQRLLLIAAISWAYHAIRHDEEKKDAVLMMRKHGQMNELVLFPGIEIEATMVTL